jgi:hypothetical protein
MIDLTNHQTLKKTKSWIQKYTLMEEEQNYICGWVPVRKGNIGGFGNDCVLIGGNIGGGKRPSTGIICDEEGDGTFIGWGLKQKSVELDGEINLIYLTFEVVNQVELVHLEIFVVDPLV